MHPSLHDLEELLYSAEGSSLAEPFEQLSTHLLHASTCTAVPGSQMVSIERSLIAIPPSYQYLTVTSPSSRWTFQSFCNSAG